jgi:hypothetical protein
MKQKHIITILLTRQAARERVADSFNLLNIVRHLLKSDREFLLYKDLYLLYLLRYYYLLLSDLTMAHNYDFLFKYIIIGDSSKL